MRIAMLMLSACLSCSAAAAEDVYIKARVGEWHVICGLKADAREFDCHAAQGVQATDDPSKQIVAFLRIEKEEQAMLYFHIARPNKKFEPGSFGGVAFSLDGKHANLNLREEHCDEKKCAIPWRVNPEYLVRLSSGKELYMVMPVDEHNGFGLPITLDGFREAYLILVDKEDRAAFLDREYRKQVEAKQKQ